MLDQGTSDDKAPEQAHDIRLKVPPSPKVHKFQ